MFPEQTLLTGDIKHLRRIAFTADMAIQNVIGDSFRGATWVSIHNGGGVGWGEVINGGFGWI
jgi:urocanate hydratase